MEVTACDMLPQIRAVESGADLGDALDIVARRISGYIADAQGSVRDMCERIAGSGGKRIRPRLVLQSGMAFAGLNDKVLDTAVAAELIHMASLVHDDVIDESPLRRGRPSVNREWGNHAAVLCGDWLFAQAFGILSAPGMHDSMRFMVEAIQSMCHGELLQAAHLYDFDMNMGAYYGVIGGKTGKLLENCCKAGAAAGGADARGVASLGLFGLNLGMAFQIIDDVLDFEGSAGRMGKPRGEDLRQGIVTLPVILLLQGGEYGVGARQALSQDRYGDGVIDAVREWLSASGSIGKAREIASSFLDKALGSLDVLPESDAKSALCALAEGLRNRGN